MPRKIDHKRVTFNASFGASPEKLIKALTDLPLTARVLTIDTALQGYVAITDITYYTQPPKKEARE